MKTLLLAPELFATDGGIPRILRLYLKALCETAGERDTVGFIALNDTVIDDIELRSHTNARFDSWLSCSGRKKRFVLAALDQGKSCDQIVCGHVGQLPVALAVKLLRPRLRYYLVAHGIEVWGPLSLLKRIALKRAEKIICVSEYTRTQLMKQCKLRPERCVVLHNALDPSFVISSGEKLSGLPPTILTVTRLSNSDRYKGVEHLIEAMPQIVKAEPRAILRIIGRGDDLPRLQRLATRIGLMSNAIQFLGYVTDAEMVMEMSRCRLFALPSRDEGFGLVYLEAMAKGRPCLGAKAGGAPEVIDDSSGLLVEYANVAEIAAVTIEGLRREWNEGAILDRARSFSYERFKAGLAKLLS